MVRKMAYIGIAYIAGLLFASFFAVNINLIFVLAIIFSIIAYAFCFKKIKKEVLVIVISFCIAIIITIVYTKLIYENIIKYDNQKVNFKGEIIDVSELNNDKAIYTVKGEINGKEKATINIFGDAIKCEYFDEIIVEGTLSKLEDSLSFPSESYYKTKNIFLETKDITSIKIIKNENPPIKKYILNYRDYIYTKITTILPGDEGAFLGALLCGEKTNLTSSANTTLFRAGIGHIISVSGAHLMIISALILWLLKKLRVRRWSRFLITEGVIIAFSIFSGLAISVIRAGIMFTILMLGTIAKRRADTLNSIGIAGLVLTIFSPYAIRDASLLLSLAGVFGLAVFAPFIIQTFNFKGKFSLLKKSFITMLCVSIVTFPFVALFFDEVSIISPITNILLAPLCEFALICGLIVAFFGGIAIIAYPFLFLGGLCLKAVLLISKMLVAIPFSYLPLGYTFIALTLGLCIFGSLLITYIFKTKKALFSSILSSILILLISTAIFQASFNNKLQIAIISQDNSTAMVLYKGGQASIIDIEGKGEISKVVQKFLNKKGIKKISILVLNDNSQKTVSSYVNNISTEIENICYFSGDKVTLPNENLEQVTSNEAIKISDYEITFMDNNNYLIKFGNFSLLCEEKNDTIANINANANANIKFSIGKDIKQIEMQNQIIKFNKDNNLTGESFIIVSEKNGDYNIRRMDYALRE